MNVHLQSPVAEKIALFRTLFKGCEDVYARRFVSAKTGKAGYSPVCGNEWVRGVCEKPRMKCSACQHQRWEPVTDEVIHAHLAGKDSVGKDFVMGLYPMLRDEKCWFLAVDFDGDGWREECLSFISVSESNDLSVALERSRSGDGGHVWIFFEQAMPAHLARALGAYLLTQATALHPQAKLHSYDRFFPNQDTLPRGGFGNLIALPLQKSPRDKGNSVFVDRDFNPYSDQWKFLSSVEKVSIRQAAILVEKGRLSGQITGVSNVSDDEPWTAVASVRGRQGAEISKEATPKSLKIVLSDQIYIPKKELSPALLNSLIRLAAFQNPEFYKAQAMRLPTYDKPRIISCAENYSKHIALPRGCLEAVQELMQKWKVKLRKLDEREPGAMVDVAFLGELRHGQKLAGDKLLEHDTGILAATTAFGKTVLAAWMITQRGVNTLILVHRKQLMEQWVLRLAEFLDLEEKEIGRLGGGRRKLKGKVDIALIQSLVRKGEVKDVVGDYGHLIIDECHHLSAFSFEQVARRAKAKYVLGLSATITRKDGHHPVVCMQCGPIRHKVDAKSEALKRPFGHEVIVRPTGFRLPMETDEDARVAYQQICETIIYNVERNRLIAEEILAAVRVGRSPLVLTERTEHIDILHRLLSDEISHVVTLKGGLKVKELKAAIASLTEIPESEPRVVVATGRFVGEGFDDSRLDTLFLTMPISWRGTVAQYAGRLHRLHSGKKLVQIYDYADLDVPMLSRMFDRRCKGYEEIGYTILLPAHALPGWPSEVPLPIDPQWKNDYAASIRRLISDGIDVPLAKLFVNVSQPADSTAKGIERARSASEKFLYQRLETLTETCGKFQLNAVLPIPFNQRSEMEVDFLFTEQKLVIELDGDQHLKDKTAYRRDRKKDALLQENGYFVLRFLTTDLGERLDFVLDDILRGLSRKTP